MSEPCLLTFHSQIPGLTEDRAVALHNYGDYNEAGYTTARSASLQYGRANLHRIASMESGAVKIAPAVPYSCTSHVSSPQILRK